VCQSVPHVALQMALKFISIRTLQITLQHARVLKVCEASVVGFQLELSCLPCNLLCFIGGSVNSCVGWN
jgi:hypothetical protein